MSAPEAKTFLKPHQQKETQISFFFSLMIPGDNMEDKKYVGHILQKMQEVLKCSCFLGMRMRKPVDCSLGFPRIFYKTNKKGSSELRRSINELIGQVKEKQGN